MVTASTRPPRVAAAKALARPPGARRTRGARQALRATQAPSLLVNSDIHAPCVHAQTARRDGPSFGLAAQRPIQVAIKMERMRHARFKTRESRPGARCDVGNVWSGRVADGDRSSGRAHHGPDRPTNRFPGGMSPLATHLVCSASHGAATSRSLCSNEHTAGACGASWPIGVPPR